MPPEMLQPFDSAPRLLGRSARVFFGRLPFLVSVTLAVFIPGKLVAQLVCAALDVPSLRPAVAASHVTLLVWVLWRVRRQSAVGSPPVSKTLVGDVPEALRSAGVTAVAVPPTRPLLGPQPRPRPRLFALRTPS